MRRARGGDRGRPVLRQLGRAAKMVGQSKGEWLVNMMEGTRSLYCMDCGARVRAAANFCGRCGTRQEPLLHDAPASSPRRAGFGPAPEAVDSTVVMARPQGRPVSREERTERRRTSFDAEPQAAARALGSRTTRVGAALIDNALVMGMLIVPVVAVFSGAVLVGPIILGSIIAWLLATIFYAPLTMARMGWANGQTFGEQLLGIRVVKEDGSPMTAGTAFKREFVGRILLSNVTLGLYGLMDVLWFLLDDHKQALHDKVGGTYVFSAEADLHQAAVLAGLRSTVAAMATAPSAPPPGR